MNQTTRTFQLARTLGAIAAVFALLFAGSSHQFLEECPHEVVTAGTEVVLVRQEERLKTVRARKDVFPVSKPTEKRLPPYCLYVSVSERDGINGLGAYLRI